MNAERTPLFEIDPEADAREVLAALMVFQKAGWIREYGAPKAEVEEETLQECPLCKAQTSHLRHHERLGREVCALCHIAAMKVCGSFDEATARHTREFYGQLEQIVRDVRAGAEPPTFYRGFE